MRWREAFMAELKELELNQISPNRFNPRLGMNIERLNELADSIKQVGLLEPLIVRPKGDRFEVVVGERRYRAAQQAGLEKVHVIVRSLTDEEVIELNLIENVQRVDLSAVEKGNCCRQLLDRYPQEHSSKQTLANKVGVSVNTISNWLRLIEAPEEIQRMIKPIAKSGVPRELGELDYSTALAITSQVEEPAKQIRLAEEIADKQIHGRKARKAIARVVREPERPIEDILEEIIKEPFELPFEADEKDAILEGSKSQTTRLNAPDRRIKAGSKVYASVIEPRFAELHILSIERKRLKHFGEEDAIAEGSSSLEEFREVWERRHGQWNEDQLVYVIRFERS
jgi:ParB family chromosome partitioning protein